MKRAVVILGAGASVDYGAPTTNRLTDRIEKIICSDFLMQTEGGDQAFLKIKKILLSYFRNPGVVNYEQIYHCAHELNHLFPPSDDAVDEYLPLLKPFVQNMSELNNRALGVLERKIHEAIYKEILACCNSPSISLEPFRDFLRMIMKNCTLRIYSTNHDDFPLQAVEELYTGFDMTTSRFDVDGFWSKWNSNAIFHLHGSIHMGFAPELSQGPNITDIYWFKNRADAYSHTRWNYPSYGRRQDGGRVARFPLITGLDKLSVIQQQPFCYYYAALAKDLMEADIIYVIGSGLGDLHLNNWLDEARSKTSCPPLLLVDKWQRGLISQRFERETKEIAMAHSLRIDLQDLPETDFGNTAGWTVTKNRTAAVWDKGFKELLADMNTLDKAGRALNM